MPTKKKAAKAKVRKVVRDSGTGQFAPKEAAKCDPDGTTTETVASPKVKTKKKVAKKKVAKKKAPAKRK